MTKVPASFMAVCLLVRVCSTNYTIDTSNPEPKCLRYAILNFITWQVRNEELILQWGREKGKGRWYIERGRERERGKDGVWKGVEGG